MYHIPVMPAESIEGLKIRPGGVYVDLTFGGGGHSKLILEKLNKEGRLIAFDQDDEATANKPDDERFTLVQHNFRYLKNFLRFHKALPADGILADLGISSHHIDEPVRGFSTRYSGPLDMRMNRSQTLTAAIVLNTYTEEQLKNIFRQYGEIPNAGKLASCIVTSRMNPFETTDDLKAAIAHLIPRKAEFKYLAQVFQALRIEVNDELGALKSMLKQVPDSLADGGRFVVIAYHSLEDRLVKNFIKTGNFAGEEKKDFFGNLIAPLSPVTRKALTPDQEELERNTRSRSAKLRIAEKNPRGKGA